MTKNELVDLIEVALDTWEFAKDQQTLNGLTVMRNNMDKEWEAYLALWDYFDSDDAYDEEVLAAVACEMAR